MRVIGWRYRSTTGRESNGPKRKSVWDSSRSKKSETLNSIPGPQIIFSEQICTSLPDMIFLARSKFLRMENNSTSPIKHPWQEIWHRLSDRSEEHTSELQSHSFIS